MAVYTQVTPEELNHFISKYNIGELYDYDEIKEGIENTNYVLQTINHPSSQPKKYILTLYEKRVKQNDLPYFLALLEHLNRNNVTCPMPLYARDGKSLQRLCGKPAVILSFIPGICPQHKSVNHCVSLGKAVAKMHIAGFDFPLERSNDMSLKNWAHLTNITQEYFGWIGNAIFIFAQLFQIVHTYRIKKTDDLSYGLEILWIKVNTMYTLFGIFDKSFSR